MLKKNICDFEVHQEVNSLLDDREAYRKLVFCNLYDELKGEEDKDRPDATESFLCPPSAKDYLPMFLSLDYSTSAYSCVFSRFLFAVATNHRSESIRRRANLCE